MGFFVLGYLNLWLAIGSTTACVLERPMRWGNLLVAFINIATTVAWFFVFCTKKDKEVQ